MTLRFRPNSHLEELDGHAILSGGVLSRPDGMVSNGPMFVFARADCGGSAMAHGEVNATYADDAIIGTNPPEIVSEVDEPNFRTGSTGGTRLAIGDVNRDAVWAFIAAPATTTPEITPPSAPTSPSEIVNKEVQLNELDFGIFVG